MTALTAINYNRSKRSWEWRAPQVTGSAATKDEATFLAFAANYPQLDDMVTCFLASGYTRDRVAKALRIVLKDDVVMSQGEYIVRGNSGYYVTTRSSCTCPVSQLHRETCHHILALNLVEYMGIRAKWESADNCTLSADLGGYGYESK